MDRFSQAYKAAQGVVKNKHFLNELEKLRSTRLKSLLADDDGPNAGEAGSLEELHNILFAKQKELFKAGGATQEVASAKAIISFVGPGPDMHRSVATLKMLKHLYHGISSGGQSIWIYAPPIAYSKWIFDLIYRGITNANMETVLAESYPEVYSKRQRDTMSSALLQARAVALSVVSKLSGSPDNATLKVLKQYFSDASTTPIQLTQTVNTLRAGYQKIANACNSSKIIISDEPGDRTSGGWKDWGFIYPSESMKVIYLQDAWLKKAKEVSPSNQSPLYRCVRTIIHELSHKELSTEDVCYGPTGLNPHGKGTPLTSDYALHNADSWAYFAIDVLGFLTGPDKTNGSKINTSILRVPSRALTTA